MGILPLTGLITSSEVGSLVLFVITVLIVMLFLYVATRLVTKEEILTAPYVVRLFITAVLAILLLPLLVGLLGDPVIGSLSAFLMLMVIVRYVIIPEASLGDEWLESVIISILLILFVYIFNYAIKELLGVKPFIDIGW